MTFLSNYRFNGMLIGALLGIALIMGQVSWSAPQPIAPEALAAQLEAGQAPLILDVRSAQEFAEGHIPGALNIPYREVPTRLHELAVFQHRNIVVYCEVGVRAGIARIALEQAGFEHISMLEGHMQAWRQVGLPIDTALTITTP